MGADNLGTYAKLVPDELTKNRIFSILSLFNIENAVSKHDLHVTVVYSREQCDSIKHIPIQIPIHANGAELAIFKNQDGSNCLVVILDSPSLQELHRHCREEHFAIHDYPHYSPHITLSYDYSGEIVPQGSLLEHFHSLYFDQYIVEPLLLNWTSDYDSAV
jgi:2'-5' RNA ligase